ncbi:DNA-3-methyladenine glycosylase family protein [Peribacillus alkalitolerans]|uniref:DNA-3-methyladenine glycosylase family protein n=1 Tax=Peribacillus alkalitolerans TaxID=1550385 RepID=UPI0013D4745D|nr:DNA-3-methyladenine glycosylase [Peribacillus alkalitolerans]
MWNETISIQGPYNFELVLERLSLDPLQCIEIENRLVKVPLNVKGNPEVISIQAIGTTDTPKFIVLGENVSTKGEVFSRIKEIFHWHIPLENIHQHFSGTKLNTIFEEHKGTALILDFDYFSCLVKCIIHQQLNLSFAHTLTERFVHTYGFEKDGTWFYPSPDRVAAIPVEELRDLQFSTRKAEYVIGLATEISEGRLDLDSLKEKSDNEVTQTLIKLRGIGNWTAENFLLFGLGRPNLFPKADIGIQNALKKLLQLPEKPTIEEMEVLSTEWAPYLSYASLYLWRSIEKRSVKS